MPWLTDISCDYSMQRGSSPSPPELQAQEEYARMRQRADAASGKHHSYKESRRFRQDGLMVHTSYEHCGACP